ncbi:MAG: hypothetical protein JWM33_350 [Caulobacteraceae bacterium]|nr:hypothetical protein [Caulobacteraceae bacterium]
MARFNVANDDLHLIDFGVVQMEVFEIGDGRGLEARFLNDLGMMGVDMARMDAEAAGLAGSLAMVISSGR